MLGPQVYITIGDEYDKKNLIPERYKGSSFKVSAPKKGTGPDALFQKKFLSLSEGDKYVDSGMFDKRYRLENEKKKITPQGFRYTNVTHKPCGSGSYFGCFCESSPWRHEVEFNVVKKAESPERAQHSLKNITTNPSKKGTYGYAGTTFGKDEFKYISDPFDAEKRRSTIASRESTNKVVGQPFKAACKRGGFFGESAHGISTVYSIDKPLPAKREASVSKPPPLVKSWMPAGRLVAEITKFPEYMEDPFEAKEKNMRDQRKKDRPSTVWKPIGGSKSLPVKPIRFTPPANVDIHV